ncbi:patatin-like phospholipase family protein [Streptomyces sp. NPDC048623]|uniref:patatin-like phospholipase family protein n=1 Tax=Streptomyces sp. NPDC048623 TaxID=3155761 RepID=UPI003430960F
MWGSGPYRLPVLVAVRSAVRLGGRPPAWALALHVPAYQACAASIERATARYFDSGPLIPAVMASCAVPGLWPPMVIGKEHYVDGGVVETVPVSRAVSYGATTVYVLRLRQREPRLAPPRWPWQLGSAVYEVSRRYHLGQVLNHRPDGVVMHINNDGVITLDELNEAFQDYFTSDDAGAVGNMIFGWEPSEDRTVSATGSNCMQSARCPGVMTRDSGRRLPPTARWTLATAGGCSPLITGRWSRHRPQRLSLLGNRGSSTNHSPSVRSTLLSRITTTPCRWPRKYSSHKRVHIPASPASALPGRQDRQGRSSVKEADVVGPGQTPCRGKAVRARTARPGAVSAG